MAKRLQKEDLNDDQQNALDFILQFIDDPARRQMLLYGAAGTGKTSLINVLLDELDRRPSDSAPRYICTAPTNKAVEVIADRTGRDYRQTIFSIMGLVLVDYDDSKPRLKKERDGSLDSYDLVIVDEASMVSLQLLAEIQRQLQLCTSVKVIYVGDRCQIPPVEDANNGMLESIIFQLPIKVELTKVMRTADENPILGVVTKMRENMQSPVDLFEHTTAVAQSGIGVWFDEYEKPFMRKMIEYFVSDKYKADSNYALAVAWTNAAVDAINARVRKAIYPDTDLEYEVGEEIRVTKTYGVDRRVGHGTIYNVVYPIEQRLKIHTVQVTEDPAYHVPCYKMYVSGRNVPANTVYVVTSDGMNTYNQVKMKLAEESRERAKTLDRNGHRLYTNKDAWKPYTDFTHFYMWPGYIYAMTAHKSQGSTVDNVFVIERNINRIEEDELRNKLKYTAFTRAAKELHVLM